MLMHPVRPAALALLVLLAGGTAAAQARPGGTIVVSNMNDATVSIVDAATMRTVATLPTGEGPHEVATSHDGRWAVVSNYGVRERAGHTLTVFDIPAGRVASQIDLGTHMRPHGMAFLPGDTTLVVTAQASGNVLLVDVPHAKVIAAVPTNGRVSHMLALAPSGERLFTTNVPDGTVSRVNLLTRQTEQVMPVAKFVEGIAVGADGKTVWVGSNGDSITVVINGMTGAVIDTLRGFGMPYRLGVSPDGRHAVIADPIRGEIRLFDAATRRQRHVIAVPKDSVVATAEVPGSPSPEGVAMSPDSRWAFVTLQGRNRVALVDLERGVIAGLAPTGVWSDGVAYSTRVWGRP